MSSEYKSSAWKILGNALGILDTKGISRRVSNEPITPVVGVDLGMQAYNLVSTFDVGTTGAITTFQWVVVGRGGSSNPAPLRQLVANNDDVETVIMGWRIDLALSALADAANLKSLNYYRLRVMGESASDPSVREAYCQRAGYYDWANGKIHLIFSNSPNMTLSPSNMPNIHQEDKPIWVPAGTTLIMCCDIDPVANFAVNATFDVEAWGVTVPKGIRPPFL